MSEICLTLNSHSFICVFHSFDNITIFLNCGKNMNKLVFESVSISEYMCFDILKQQPCPAHICSIFKPTEMEIIPHQPQNITPDLNYLTPGPENKLSLHLKGSPTNTSTTGSLVCNVFGIKIWCLDKSYKCHVCLVPEHTIPISSLCPQQSVGVVLFTLHSHKFLSVPLHFILLMWMGPLPAPKFKPNFVTLPQPSWAQTTTPLWLSKSSSHTVPHCPLCSNSTRPTQRSCPPANRAA